MIELLVSVLIISQLLQWWWIFKLENKMLDEILYLCGHLKTLYSLRQKRD